MKKALLLAKRVTVYFLSHPYQRTQAIAAGAAILEILRVAVSGHA